jgi:hypothetical protein
VDGSENLVPVHHRSPGLLGLCPRSKH